MATTTIDADRISPLPDHIVHHILTFLSTKEVVRVSVLSKAWNGFFASFPLSDFSELSFSTASDWKLKFANFVYSSLLRQCLHNTRIPKFQLSAIILHDDNYTDVINQSIRLSTQYGVKELSLRFYGSRNYRLPEAIFSTKELVVFRLSGSSLDSTVNWPSLREFSLKNVFVSDQSIIDNLIFTCPLIENFALTDCIGTGYLKLLGLKKLKEVKIHASYCVLEKIEIDSLSLQTFSFSCHWQEKKVHFALSPCKNLEVLEFSNKIIDQTIECLLSNFPALKVLALYRCKSQKIEISSLKLERLQLCNLQVNNIVISAPRLWSFESFIGKGGTPSLFSINKTSLQEVSLGLDLTLLYCRYQEHLPIYLMEYLKNFNQIKLVTLKIFNWISFEIPKILRNISHPVIFYINHLKLEIDIPGNLSDQATAEEGFEALVDYLLYMYRPESLVLLQSDWCRDDGVINVLCKKLVNYRVKDEHCCADKKSKCWRHDLKDIMMEHYGENGDREVVTCDALFDSLHRLVLKKNIRFVFEW